MRLLCAIALVMVVANQHAYATDPNKERCDTEACIIKVINPPLDLFKEPKVGPPLASFNVKKGEEVFLPILKVSKNRMLYVEYGGKKGWVMPTFVETNFKQKALVVGDCKTGFSGPRVAAARGLGEGCD